LPLSSSERKESKSPERHNRFAYSYVPIVSR
jgi:hypothetical protein